MAVQIQYANDESISVAQWESLASGAFANSAIFDNTSNLYDDVLVGGEVAVAATTIAVGDTVDIYVGALYDKDTTTTAGGGIGAAFDPGTPATETADTDFVLANLIPFQSVSVKSASPDGTYDLVFNPKAVAAYFNGVLPQKIFFTCHNNTGAAMTTGNVLNAVGIKYTNA